MNLNQIDNHKKHVRSFSHLDIDAGLLTVIFRLFGDHKTFRQSQFLQSTNKKERLQLHQIRKGHLQEKRNWKYLSSFIFHILFSDVVNS